MAQATTYSVTAEQVLANLRLEFAAIARCTGYFQFGTDWNHKHVQASFNRLYLIASGWAEATIDGHKQALTPGYAYLLPCNTDVSLRCPAKMSQWRTHFNMWFAGRIDVFRAIPLKRYRLKPDRVFVRNFKALSAQFPPKNLRSALACLRYLAYLVEPFINQLDQAGLVDRLRQMAGFAPVLRLVEHELQTGITAERMARSLGYTSDHFTEIFKRTFGCSPHQYIIRKRISRARNLLVTSARSIKEIAALCGFQDQYYFSRIFRKYEFVPPSVYRRRFSVLPL